MSQASYRNAAIGSIVLLLIAVAIGAAAWAPAQPAGNRGDPLEYAALTRTGTPGLWRFSSPAESFGPSSEAEILRALGRVKGGADTTVPVLILNAIADRGWQMITYDRGPEDGHTVETWWLRRGK